MSPVEMPLYKVPEEGVYQMVLKEAKEMTFTGPKGDFNRAHFMFQLNEKDAGTVKWTPRGTDEEQEGRWLVRANMPIPNQMSSGTKLYQFLETWLGSEMQDILDKAMQVDEAGRKNFTIEKLGELLRGRNGKGLVSLTEDKQGRKWANVEYVKPYTGDTPMEVVVYGPADEKKDEDLPF